MALSIEQFHGFSRCESAEVLEEKRTLTDREDRSGTGRRVARRQGRLSPDPSEPAAIGPSLSQRRGGPIGVVKLLRARGGCLGVIRIRAWKAAKSPGELPNERRSRNARGDPGN